MFGTLFILVTVVAGAAYAREYNCTVDESLCTGSGMQTIFVSGLRMCCPPSASFSLNNNDCKCVEPDVPMGQQCLQGVSQCRDANSFSTDSNGVLRCCMPGFILNSVSNGVVNGVLMDFCSCTPFNNGANSFMSSVFGMNTNNDMPRSNILSAQTVVSGGNNATDFRDEWRQMANEWRNWGQNFGSGFRQWGQNFGRNMRNTGLDLARDLSGTLQTSLRNTMGPLQRALNGMMANVFRSIPGF